MSSQKATPRKNKMNVWMWVGIVVVVLVAAAIVYAMVPRQTTATLPAEISVADAYSKRESGAFILDVRQPDEWNTVHIPGANLIPLGELESRLNEVPRDQEVVVVCHSGNRSKQGRDILEKSGFEQVTSVKGGMTQWEAAGYPTVSGP
jgi:rhodanese-related sulfurtransferase